MAGKVRLLWCVGHRIYLYRCIPCMTFALEAPLIVLPSVWSLGRAGGARWLRTWLRRWCTSTPSTACTLT